MKCGTDNFSFTTVVKLKLQDTCKQFRCTCLIGNMYSNIIIHCIFLCICSVRAVHGL